VEFAPEYRPCRARLLGVGVIEAAQISEKDYAARLARARLIALNRQGRVSNFVPPINSLILIGMLWGQESPTLLLVWVGLVWASSAWRMGMYRAFDRAVAREQGDEEHWKILSIGSYGLSGAVWGIGTFLMFPQDSFLVQAFLMVFVLGMGAGGTASFAPYFPALLASPVFGVHPTRFFKALPSASSKAATIFSMLSDCAGIRASNRSDPMMVRWGMRTSLALRRTFASGGPSPLNAA